MAPDTSLTSGFTTSNDTGHRSCTRLGEVKSDVDKLRGDKRKIDGQTKRQYELIGQIKKWKAKCEQSINAAESTDIEALLKIGTSLHELSEIIKDVDPEAELSEEDDDTIISTDIENGREDLNETTFQSQHDAECSKIVEPLDQSNFKTCTSTSSKTVPLARLQVRNSTNKRLSLSTYTDYLTIENGTSNCFLAVSMNLIHSMTKMIEELVKIPPIIPKVVKMMEVLEHRTHSVDCIRRQLDREFTQGNQSVSSVLQILLDKWIPESLHSFYEATFEQYHQCTNGIKKKTWQNIIFDKIVKSDNLLRLLLEETKEVYCNDCDRLVEPRVRLTDDNPDLKYLVVAFAKQQGLKVYLEDDNFESMGRRMRIVTLVEYKKDIEHFVCWRRVEDRIHPWRIVDSLNTEPLKQERLKQPFNGLSVMLLEIIPKTNELTKESQINALKDVVYLD
ncbi:hypothetical protein M3Y95_00867200 [Aphelenchoides besseyi]|nr:hypothetical protein M3Y95_00867200 [Aphelenchoides besseyi]